MTALNSGEIGSGERHDLYAYRTEHQSIIN